MKILNLSLDRKIMDKESAVAKRMVWFGEIVDRYTIIVPFKKQDKVMLAKNVRVYGSGGTAKIIQFFLLYFVARRLIERDGGYDVITVQDSYFIGLLGLILSSQFDVGLEVQVHGWGKVGFVKKIVRKFVLKRANGVRVVSERMKKDVIKFGVKKKDIKVVPVFTELKIGEKKKHEIFTFITVSRLVEIKNIEMQLHAAAELVKIGKQFRLVIVGEGKYRGILEDLVCNLNLEKVVEFVGWKDDAKLADVYEKSDCILLTSNSEGWGRVILEAGGYGVPTIMTDVGLAGEVIENEKNGVVIKLGDEEALIESMKRVMMDTEFYDFISKNVRETVNELPFKSDVLALYVGAWNSIL